jgi:hypothetical protein
MSAVEVDIAGLAEAINTRLFRTGKSANDVARVLGFSPQVFSDIKAHAQGKPNRRRTQKIKSGYVPGTAIFLTICWWLDRDPRDFQKIVMPVADEEHPGSG